jgi:exodeoxyribonuclease VIII
MTEFEYRSAPAISRSQLWKINDSPEKFKYEIENPSAPTESLLFGQVFHKMVLEPDTFGDEFAVAPKVDRRTKAGKAEYDEFLGSSGDKTVISDEMFTVAQSMAEKLKASPYVQKLLSGEHEKPFFWTDELTGEPCKCRTDALVDINGQSYIVDLKTAADASTDAFMRHAVKYGYHLQAAMYSEGVKSVTGKECGFVFIVIEKDPPYSVNILQADAVFVKHGYDVFRELIGIYHDCKQTGNWYGYLGKFDSINTLGLPSYLAKEVE